MGIRDIALLASLTGLRPHRLITGAVVAGGVAGAAVNVAMLLRAARAQAAPAPAAGPPAPQAGNSGDR
jgi:hypothetical protein